MKQHEKRECGILVSPPVVYYQFDREPGRPAEYVSPRAETRSIEDTHTKSEEKDQQQGHEAESPSAKSKVERTEGRTGDVAPDSSKNTVKDGDKQQDAGPSIKGEDSQGGEKVLLKPLDIVKKKHKLVVIIPMRGRLWKLIDLLKSWLDDAQDRLDMFEMENAA